MKTYLYNLTVEEANTIIGILNEAPYKIVAPIINKMVEQYRSQAGADEASASLPKIEAAQ